MRSGWRRIRELGGHTAPVLCCEAHPGAAQHLLASGGEVGGPHRRATRSLPRTARGFLHPLGRLSAVTKGPALGLPRGLRRAVRQPMVAPD